MEDKISNFENHMEPNILFRSSRAEVFWKKVFLKISQNSQENIFARVFFNKVAGLRPATLLKKRLAQLFSCEFCEISKNTFSHRTTPVIASKISNW